MFGVVLDDDHGPFDSATTTHMVARWYRSPTGSPQGRIDERSHVMADDMTQQVAVIAKLPAAPGKRDELVAALQAALDTAERRGRHD